jgi:hypothetical protein
MRNKSQDTAQGTPSQSHGWFESIRDTLTTALGKLGVGSSRKQSQLQGPDPADGGPLGLDPTLTTTGHRKYLQLCISRYRRYEQISYSSHNLQIDSDKLLYDSLRSQYNELNGRWRRLLTLRRIARIRFAKVSYVNYKQIDSYKLVVPVAKNQIRRGRDPLRNTRAHPGELAKRERR